MAELEFTNEEKKQLAEVEAQLTTRAHHAITTAQLAFSWARFAHFVEQGYDDSIYEYTNDLSTRDLLARIVQAAPDALANKINQHLAPPDEQFRKACHTVDIPLKTNAPAEAWWWYCVPNQPGDELESDLAGLG